MNTTLSSVNSGGDKRLLETTVQTVAQNLTTMQSVPSVQNVQSVVQSSIQNIQPSQTIVGSVGTSSSLVGKSVSLDINPKLSIMKSVVPSGTTSSTESSKITTTLCSVGSAVRIITPGMLSTVERPNQPQPQQLTQQVNMPATYHVPRGPAAVANISAPRSTVATPIVRANTGQTVPTTRPGNTTISNPQWQPKTTSVVYAQQQRHPIPPVSRVSRPSSVYTSQQPRLITPTSQGRSVQATMATGSPSRLIAPILQTNNSITTRLPLTQSRPPTPQVVTVTQTTQPGRSSTQTIQPANQPNRPLTATGAPKRMAVSTPVVETANRIGTSTVTVEPTVGRQLSINTVAGPSTVNHIVIPSGQVQQHQSTTPRVQTVTSLSNLNTVTQVITTTTNTSNATRILQAAPTVTRLTGMTLHQLPLVSRATPAPVKTVQPQNVGQTVQIKSPQQANLRVSTPAGTNNNTTTSAQPVQGQYIHPPPHTTTYYSFEGYHPTYRQTSVQPVRLLVDSGYEEPHGKPNASPRPSILRKRDHDTSPIKGAAKNLVPVLASLPSSRSTASPPCSPRGDQDGGGCPSSGSTTVSATSSPGLDEEPEQSRITINPTVEMSPRKKPRKQQLTGVELTELRCTEEEMEFITEDKVKREIKEESKDKSDKRQGSNSQRDIKSPTQQTEVTIRTRPMPSLLGSWKNRWGGRLHHYRRPSDVRPREERRPTVAELAQQKHMLQKLNGWKVYHLSTQMEDIAELEKQVYEKLKTTLVLLESQQVKSKHNDGLERVNELIKGNMQRSSLISEGMNEARIQLDTIFQHKQPIIEILQRSGNKRTQKKRDK